MAASEAAVPSSVGGRRASPPPASKRDRKRQLLVDRLAAMNDKFHHEKDRTYRDQLQKVSLDTNLVQRFDPYDPKALDIIADLQKEHDLSLGAPVHAEGARSLLEMAGINFTDFMSEIEDLVERRDFELSQSKLEFDRKAREYKNVHDYKAEAAKREHQALTSTLRDRLVNTLTHKKNRLNKEKEVLEINDSNALLLNPNQFSITNPSSPGGPHGKRATRLRKDADDIGMYSEKKRKRNAGDDDGSPAPIRRALDPTNTTPLWQSEKARAAAKQNGPLYSIDKLFTDKELSHHYNIAAVAAHQYILRHRVNGNGSSPEDSDSGNGDGDTGEDNESIAAAPMMERQVSHATRSTRGAAQNFIDDKILGVQGIANFEVPASMDLLQVLDPPKLPPAIPAQYLKAVPKAGDHNYPVPLSNNDADADMQVIDYMKRYDETHKPGAYLDAPSSGLRKILEAVAVPSAQSRYVAFAGAPRDDADILRDTLAVSSLRNQPSPMPGGYAAAPMSRQSSLGGVAMSRTGTNTSTRGRGRRN